MQDLAETLITLLTPYAARSLAGSTGTTTLASLGIGELDLPMILLDIEDAFNIPIPLGVETQDLATFGSLIAVARLGLAAKALPRRHVTPRKKSSWMSTSAQA
ncbi:MAG: hypothetical protein AB7E80_11380 [Hyphomicrobiaceae bacterium]